MVPVLNAGFNQFGISVGVGSLHDQFLPPAPPAPLLKAMPGIIEGPAFMGWPPGFFVHKKANTVLVDGTPGIQQGHDVGPLILHVPAPINVLMAVHMLFSKHKVMIPVSSVEMEGKPVGTYFCALFLGLNCASPFSLPAGILVRTKNTVVTNASLADMLKGVAYIALDIALDLLWNKLKGAKWFPKFKSDALLEQLKPYLVGMLGIEVLESILHKLARDVMPEVIRELIFRELANRIIQNIAKAWVFSPVVGGVARGAPAIGRGKAGWKPKIGPFGKELW
jgi:hypothetical protein